MSFEARPAVGEKNTPLAVANNKKGEPLHACVREALTGYFRQLNGHHVSDLYRMVLSEVELPLLETVMREVEGNQSRAASVLGISRSTLRKKLAQYNLD
jgi:Fis family transcriptional regulator